MEWKNVFVFFLKKNKKQQKKNWTLYGEGLPNDVHWTSRPAETDNKQMKGIKVENDRNFTGVKSTKELWINEMNNQ